MSELRVIEEETPTCKRCGSTRIAVSNQYYSKKKRAIIQRYKCKACGSFFTAGSYMGFGADKATIDYAVDLVKRGYSTVEVIAKVKETRDETFSRGTICHWVNRFAPGLRGRPTHNAGPRRLAESIRKLVTAEALAADMRVSPRRVEELLASLEAYTKTPVAIKLGRELRTLHTMSSELTRLSKVAAKTAKSIDARTTRKKHVSD